MEVHQLRYLAAVVDEGSFTAAAARLHVSQSGVSTQVAKLERELGQRLLDRPGGRVEPTDLGEAVLPLVREALACLDAVTDTAAEFADAVRGRVRLGAIAGCTIPGFLDTIASLGRTHPGVVLSLVEDDSTSLQRRVAARDLDLALVSFAARGARPGLDVRMISDEPLAAALSPDHPLAKGSIRLDALVEEKVLCLPPGTGIRTAYERSCLQAGLEPHVALDASSPPALLGLARRGAGVAVLTASAAEGSGLQVTPIEGAGTHACLGLVSRADQRSPAARLVLELLVDALAPSTSS